MLGRGGLAERSSLAEQRRTLQMQAWEVAFRKEGVERRDPLTRVRYRLVPRRSKLGRVFVAKGRAKSVRGAVSSDSPESNGNETTLAYWATQTYVWEHRGARARAMAERLWFGTHTAMEEWVLDSQRWRAIWRAVGANSAVGVGSALGVRSDVGASSCEPKRLLHELSKGAQGSVLLLKRRVPDKRPHLHAVTPPAQELPTELRPTTWVEIEVVDLDGFPVEGVRAQVRPSSGNAIGGRTLDDGVLRRDAILRGRTRIEFAVDESMIRMEG